MRRSKMAGTENMPLMNSPAWSECEGLIKAFEAAWRRGDAPAIEEYLRTEGSERSALLVELVHIELEFRLKSGESVYVERYLSAYPQLADNRDTVLDLITAEYQLRLRLDAKGISEKVDRGGGFATAGEHHEVLSCTRKVHWPPHTREPWNGFRTAMDAISPA